LGYYLIGNFTYTINTNGYTISINGKDKMSQLNGEFGGVFTNLSTNISSIDIMDKNGKLVTTE
jgi:hypothetical protein